LTVADSARIQDTSTKLFPLVVESTDMPYPQGIPLGVFPVDESACLGLDLGIPRLESGFSIGSGELKLSYAADSFDPHSQTTDPHSRIARVFGSEM
jgi:hypothetical protein